MPYQAQQIVTLKLKEPLTQAEKQCRYRAKNLEKCKAAIKQWAQDNPDRVKFLHPRKSAARYLGY